MNAPAIASLEEWIDHVVVDNDGHRIGIIADVYIDDASGYPEWLAVMTGLFGSRLSFVPVAGAVEAGGKICITFAKAFVKDSPNIDTDGTLTPEEEQRLYRHYGMKYAELDVNATSGEESPTSGTKVRQRRLRRRGRKAEIDLRETENQ